MSMLNCRFVSISASSIKSPLYLCEVEVLSPLVEHVALAQCGDGAGQDQGVIVYSNTCLVVQAKQKMDFIEGQQFCREKGMVLLHNETQADSLAYEFVK